MQAPFINGGGSGETGSLQLTFHAALAVDTGGSPEWRNWSYWHSHFDRLTPQQAKVTGLYGVECLSQVSFALKLPLLAN